MESLPEVRTEVGVDEGIERGIKVANPEECSDDGVGAAAGGAAYIDADVPGEEGKPAKHEGSHDEPECSSRFVFSPPHR